MKQKLIRANTELLLARFRDEMIECSRERYLLWGANLSGGLLLSAKPIEFPVSESRSEWLLGRQAEFVVREMGGGTDGRGPDTSTRPDRRRIPRFSALNAGLYRAHLPLGLPLF